jgi:hypothetical protein
MKILYKSLFLVLTVCQYGVSQNIEIEKISTKKPLQVSGGLNANALFTQGIADNNAPFNYFLSGYLTFTAFNALNIPVMINYSDRKVNLSQGYSFNQISIHPSYKWATAHLGTTNMSFSPYTLNGHQFTGAGVELSPGNWKIQIMRGRLLKAQHEDTLNTGPTFKRTGFGYRLEYNNGTFLLGTTLFKAKDDENSIPESFRIFQEQVVNANENTVVALHFGATILKKFQLNGEFSNSLLTKDKSDLYEKVKVGSLARVFQTSNATTESNNAFNLKASYNITATNTNIGLGYERVDPNYRTLGGYYFVNDMVNYTFNFNQMISKGRYVLGGNIGMQQDDIKKTKANKQRRFVGNVNAQARFSEKLSMGMMFSNFQSYRFLNDTYSRMERIPGEIVDTLDYALVSRTLGYNLVNYLQKTEEKELFLSFNTNYIASQSAHTGENAAKTNILNTVLTLGWRLPKKGLGLHTALTHFYNHLDNGKLSGLGPTIGLQKNVKEALSFSLNLSAINVKNPEIDSNYWSANSQGNAAWKINNNSRFNVNVGFVRNQQNSFLNGNLGYNYTFK